MSKTIISCYKCGKQMRVPTDKHIRFNCVNCREAIEVKDGLIFTPITIIGDSKQEKETAKKKKRNTELIVVGIIFLFVVGVTYAFKTHERRSFEKISQNPTVYRLQNFIRTYSKGEYTTAAINMKDSLVYFSVNEARILAKEETGVSDCSRLKEIRKKLTANYFGEALVDYEECLWDNVEEKRDFAAITAYSEAFPEGKYKDSLATANAQVWEHLYKKYSSGIKEGQVSNDAKGFVKALLNYAESTGEMRMQIVFQSNVIPVPL